MTFLGILELTTQLSAILASKRQAIVDGTTETTSMLNDHVAKLNVSIHPEELEMLQRVLDHVCETRRLDARSQRAASVASMLIDLFQHGIRSERQLKSMLD